MKQSTLLNELTDKRRKKYWEYKDFADDTLQKERLKIQLQSLNNQISYLQAVTKKP